MARRKYARHFSVIKSLNEVNTRVNQRTHIPITMLIILFIALLMISLIWQKIKIGQLRAEIEDLKSQEQNLLEQNEKTRIKVLNLMNDSRIIHIAKNNLDMTFPDYEVISLPDNFKKQETLIKKIMAGD